MAAALAQGHNASDARKKPDRIKSCGFTVSPFSAPSIALTPKISTGMNNGKISSESNTPPRRDPKISAAPIAPIRLSEGVPNTKTNINIAMPSVFILSMTAITGAATINGRPVVSQWVTTFANTIISSGNGDNAKSSRLPSS